MPWDPIHENHSIAVMLALVLVLGGVFVSGCLDLDSDEEDDRVYIVVSVLPQKEFAERVGGEHVKITVMVGEGQDPHGYEPRPSQLKDVARADIYFMIGAGLEFENIWMDTLIEQNGDMEIVDASIGIDLLVFGNESHSEEDGTHEDDDRGGTDENGTKGEENETKGEENGTRGEENETRGEENETRGEENGTRGGENDSHGEEEDEHDHEDGDHDPHIWTSPRNAMVMVENLRDALLLVDPDHANEYTNNSREYLSELEMIDSELHEGLEPFTGGRFLVYHPSFGYLAREYNLTQIAIEDEGKEPTPSGIQAIIDQARAENITTVFVSPQFDRANAETIADEISGVVVSIDPLDGEYARNMREIGAKLMEGFARGEAE